MNSLYSFHMLVSLIQQNPLHNGSELAKALSPSNLQYIHKYVHI